MKVAPVAKPNAPLETVARASDVVAVLGNGGLGHLAAARCWWRRLARADRGQPVPHHRRAARRARLAVGHLGRFRGYAALQRADRRRGDDRDLSRSRAPRKPISAC